jgi:DNA-3-methyladenine glycosylase II
MKINEHNRAVKHFLKLDASIYALMSHFGPIELKLRRNYFKALTRSIIGQQLSVQSAKAIINRFEQFFGKDLNPDTIKNTKSDQLRSLGLSNAKAKYVKDLSDKIIEGQIDLRGISRKSEAEIMHELTKVKGIGEWTVHMFLIFVLGKPDILPHGDLGIKKAIMLNYSLKNLPTSEAVIKISKQNKWTPFNSYASMYLWKSLEGN